MTRSPLRLALVAALGAFPLARSHAQAPPRPGASPPAAASTPATPATPTPAPPVVTPKRLTATVIVRDTSGKELRRSDADASAQSTSAKGECAVVQGGPLSNMVALAVGAKGQLMVQAQIADAAKKPTLKGLSLTLMEQGAGEMSTLEFDANACKLESAKFDGQTGDFDIKCDNAGRGLRAPRNIEVKLHVEGCPAVAAPQIGAPTGP